MTRLVNHRFLKGDVLISLLCISHYLFWTQAPAQNHQWYWRYVHKFTGCQFISTNFLKCNLVENITERIHLLQTELEIKKIFPLFIILFHATSSRSSSSPTKKHLNTKSRLFGKIFLAPHRTSIHQIAP